MAPLAIPLIAQFTGSSYAAASMWVGITSAASTAATVGGIGMGVAGALHSGKAQQTQLNYQAQLEEREARALKQKSIFDQKRHAKRAVEIESALKTDLAASGARTDVGAPLMLQEEQAAELELENLLIGAEGQQGYEDAMLQAKFLKKKGTSARKASYYAAGETLLKGFNAAWS